FVNSAFDRTARLLRQMIRPIRPSTRTMITAARAHIVITVGPLALTLKSPLELCKTIVPLLDDVASLLPLCMDGKLTWHTAVHSTPHEARYQTGERSTMKT